MKRIQVLKTTLAAAIALSVLTSLGGCVWHHDDRHYDERGHPVEHVDVHVDDHH